MEIVGDRQQILFLCIFLGVIQTIIHLTTDLLKIVGDVVMGTQNKE